MIRKRYQMMILCLFAGIVVSGCGKKEEIEPPEQRTTIITDETMEWIEPISFSSMKEHQIEAVTEAEIIAETETESEEIITRETLEAGFQYKNTEGELRFTIKTEGETIRNVYRYGIDENNLALFEDEEDETGLIYIGRNSFINDGIWRESDVSYVPLHDPFSDKNAVYMGKSTVNGTTCDLISSSGDEKIRRIIEKMFILGGYKSASVSSANVRYFILDHSLVVTDITGSFSSEGSSGTFDLMLIPKENLKKKTEPSAKIEERVNVVYKKGTIDDALNTYMHDGFGIMFSGGDVISLDLQKTNELAASYDKALSPYFEEAYAASRNGIVSILAKPVKSSENTDTILLDYLKACSASDLGRVEDIKIGRSDAKGCYGIINGEKTYTYCLSDEDTALIIMIYYRKDEDLESIKKRFTAEDEDPDWVIDSHTANEYTFTTPEGFYIDPNESTSYSVDLLNHDYDIYCFLYSGAEIEDEKDNDSASTLDERVVVRQEEAIDTKLGPGIYLVLEIAGNGKSCIQHEYLIQSGDTVLKYLTVLSDDPSTESDPRSMLDLIVDHTSYVPETESEILIEDEE